MRHLKVRGILPCRDVGDLSSRDRRRYHGKDIHNAEHLDGLGRGAHGQAGLQHLSQVRFARFDRDKPPEDQYRADSDPKQMTR